MFALRQSDIDFESNTVSINKQLQKVNRSWCFTQLKTDRSYQVIKFGDKFKDYLINQKEKQEQNKIFQKIIQRKFNFRFNSSWKARVIIN